MGQGTVALSSVDSGQLEQALLGPIGLAQGPSILAARRAGLADLVIRYDGDPQKGLSYRCSTDPEYFTPAFLRLYQRGRLGTTILP